MNQELWLVRGRTPVLWTVPFFAAWKDDTATLIPAVPLMGKHIRMIGPTMTQAGKEVAVGKWEMSLYSLNRLATKLPEGTDPAAVFSWHLPHVGEAPGALGPIQAKNVAATNEFVNDLFLKGVGHTREEVYWWWTQICNHAIDTLINQEKPVDLGFVKLHSVPYRRNWPYVIMSRLPTFGRLLCRTKGFIPYPSLRGLYCNRSGFDEELLGLDLLAMHKKEGYCYRYVEVEHTKKWWKTVRLVEKTRLTLLGAEKYATYFMASIRRRLETFTQLYSLWCCNLAQPCVKHVECGDEGEFRFAPHTPHWKERHISSGTNPVPVVVSNKLPKYKPARPLGDLYEKDQLVPPVSDAEYTETYLWDGGGELLQPTNQNPGTAGVLVQNAG